MVRSIDVGYGAGTHMAARVVLDKVDWESGRNLIPPPTGLARTRALCARVNVQRASYHGIAAVAKLRCNVKGVPETEF